MTHSPKPEDNEAVAPALYGLLGYPLGHSRSPAMHQAALAHCGLPGTYLALPVTADDLAGAIAGVRAWRLPGLNVTVPHKEAVLALVDGLTPHARRIGAVNTLYWEGSALWGDNTDHQGFLDSLPEGLPLAGASVTVLGAGGSARAVVAALADRGVRTIHLAARRPERAEALAEALLGSEARGRVVGLAGEALAGVLAESQLLVNTTPVGSDGFQMPIDACWLQALRADAFVYDLIYQPAETPLLAAARERGLQTQNGLEMLIAQAARAFERWTGQAPPLAVMRAAAEAQAPAPPPERTPAP